MVCGGMIVLVFADILLKVSLLQRRDGKSIQSPNKLKKQNGHNNPQSM
jgi:uncharacterized membrane protein affecting hemolysin expression